MTTQTIGSNHIPLTPYKPGSLKEAWKMLFPLIIVSFFSASSLGIDWAILLSHFGQTSIIAGTSLAEKFILTLLTLIGCITSIAVIFVGQLNGAKHFNQVGKTVWQMLWLSVMCFALCIPLAYKASAFLNIEASDALKIPFFQSMLYIMPLFATVGALRSFFVGIARLKRLVVITIFSFILNILLKCALIFGVTDYFEPMGLMVAPIATGLSMGVEILILGAMFLSQKYHLKYNTRDFGLKLESLWACLKLGLPVTTGYVLESLAHFAQIYIISKVSVDLINTVMMAHSNIGSFLLIAAAANAVISSLCANYMGRRDYQIIPKVFSAVIKLYALIILTCVSISKICGMGALHILKSTPGLPQSILENLSFEPSAFIMLGTAFLILNGLNYIINGILAAAGDVKFVMVNGIGAWLFGVLPLFLSVNFFKPGATAVYVISMSYLIANFAILFWRYKTGAWKINRVRPELLRD